MKKILPFVLIGIFLLAIVGVFYWWKGYSSALSSDKTKVSFVIPKGYSATQIGNKLQKENLIRSGLAFKVYIMFSGKASKIQSGEYDLSASQNLIQIVETLIKGPTQIWVTIPEGLRREEIAYKFATGLGKKGADIQTFVNEFISSSEGKEGYLYPNTYLLPKEYTATKVVAMMTKLFDKEFNSILDKSTLNSKMAIKDFVILASLVERETRADSERALVAGILYKRMEIGMPLQLDATVQYVIGGNSCKGKLTCNWWPVTSLTDRQVDSKFNTYKYQGLPPAPIANPGLSSLEAVLSPEESNYLYYLHDKSGVIHFASTLQEHNGNVNKYIR